MSGSGATRRAADVADPRSGGTAAATYHRRMATPLAVAMTVEQCWQPVPGGSGSYVVELTRALAARDDVRVRGLSARHAAPAPADWLPACPTTASALPRPLLYESWNRLRAPRAESTLRGRPDVVHATTWAVPPTRSPLVVTVHDLAFRRNAEHFTARGVRFFERALERTRGEARLVIVPSQVTADDCVAAGIDEARIRVVHHGVRVDVPTAADVDLFRRTHDLPTRYLLWCGTLEPRKNLAGLLRAFALVAPSDPGLHLVLVGPTGWGDAGVPADLGALAGRVHVLGRLPRADLHAAYAGATAFCFPSFWEGFGLPVAEAMAHGLPVVTSAGTSTAELAGDAGLLVDPLDDRAVAHGIERAVGAEHDRLAAASRARALAFTWERAAELTLAVYREAAGVAQRGSPGTAG